MFRFARAQYVLVVVLAACVDLKGAVTEGPDRAPSVEPGDGGAVIAPGGGPGGGSVDAATEASNAPPNDAQADGAMTAADAASRTAKVESLTVGENVACVVFEEGVMRCWGFYLLAGGGSSGVPTPSPIPIRASDGGGFLTGVAEVSASYRHACVRLFSGGFACWGFNNEYQLGDFTRDSLSTAVTPFARFVKDASVAGPLLKGPMSLAGVGRVSAGARHSAAIIDGSVLTWGDSSDVLGRGKPSDSDAMTPKPVLAVGDQPTPADDRLLGARSVDIASVHGCASLTNNTVACWGDNFACKLGIGGCYAITDGRPRIVSVPDGTGLLRVATGVTSSCAVTAMGRVRCWGQNNLGQVGKDGAYSYAEDASFDVRIDATTVLEHVIDVGVGDSFACALTEATAGGKVYCWGSGAGSVLGDGTTDARPFARAVASALVPTKVDLQGARLLAVGDRSACVVVADRDVRCWGQGPIGERGQSSSTSSIPRAVDDLP